MTIWDILEISPTTQQKTIKLAYAKLLKKYHPEENAQEFQRLRQAYELALAYASGQTININMDTEQAAENNPMDNMDKTAEPMSETDPSPSDVAFFVLDELSISAQQAFDAMQNFKQKGYFDNLVFSEAFQHCIAINCLTVVHRQAPFVDYLIDFFNWIEMVENIKPNNMMHVAVLNLIYATRDYRFYAYLEQLSTIETKKQAISKAEAWESCVAAKAILQPPKLIKFFFINQLRRRQREKIYTLIDELRDNYPSLIGRVNIDSYYWWRKSKRGDLSINFYKLINYLFMLMLTTFFIINLIVSDDNTQPRSETTATQESQATTNAENAPQDQHNLILETYENKDNKPLLGKSDITVEKILRHIH